MKAAVKARKAALKKKRLEMACMTARMEFMKVEKMECMSKLFVETLCQKMELMEVMTEKMELMTVYLEANIGVVRDLLREAVSVRSQM